MAIRRGRLALSPPRLVTLLVSIALVAVALASMHLHLPAGQSFVAQHRFWIVVGAYVILALGVLLPGL